MTRFTHTLVPALLGLALSAAAANAQTTTATPTAPERRGPSMETMQRLEDGRFAMVKAALKLTDAQLKLWQPVEDLIRKQHAERMQHHMHDHAAWRDAKAGDAASGAASNDTPRRSLADRFEQDGVRMAARAEQVKTFAATFKPFYESLADDQKAVAGPLMAELTGGHRHGRHFAAQAGPGDDRHGSMRQ